jgi:hypothetical protein
MVDYYKNIDSECMHVYFTYNYVIFVMHAMAPVSSGKSKSTKKCKKRC